jgi:hypothetical protein
VSADCYGLIFDRTHAVKKLRHYTIPRTCHVDSLNIYSNSENKNYRNLKNSEKTIFQLNQLIE